jgi:hypothetical protein
MVNMQSNGIEKTRSGYRGVDDTRITQIRHEKNGRLISFFVGFRQIGCFAPRAWSPRPSPSRRRISSNRRTVMLRTPISVLDEQ